MSQPLKEIVIWGNMLSALSAVNLILARDEVKTMVRLLAMMEDSTRRGIHAESLSRLITEC